MTKKLMAALLGALLVATVLTPTANAGNNGVVSEGDNPADFLYWEDGWLVMTLSAEAFCFAEGPPSRTGQVVMPRNGSLMLHTRDVIEASVYEIPDIDPLRIDLVVQWLFENCETEPYATGVATLRSRFRFDTKGVLHIRNGLNGTLQTADGDSVRVHTFARLTVDAATGALINLLALDANVN